MKSLIAQVIFATLALTGVQIAQADTNCAVMDASTIVSTRDDLTTKLRVANFHADLKDMLKAKSELDAFVNSCKQIGKHPSLVCNSDCQYERAQYYFFRAVDLSFLSSRGANANLNDSSADVLADADKGLAILEEGRAQLPAEFNVKSGAAGESTYNEFLKQDMRFVLQMSRLHTAIGDQYYRTVSSDMVSRIQNLADKMMEREVSTESSQGCRTRICDARARYQKAMWMLIEAKAGLPATNFDDLRNLIFRTENDLKTRIQSLDSGFLFIGIDPLAVTHNSTQDLLTILGNLRTSIQNIEGNISALATAWQAESNSIKGAERQEERYLNQQDMNRKIYQIDLLEQQARSFAEDVRNKLDIMSSDKEALNNRREKRQAKFELELQEKQTGFEIADTLRRSNQELLALDFERNVERRSQLQWLINMETTNLGLKNQILSLESQIAEYTQRKRSTQTDIEILDGRIDQNTNKDKQYDLHNANDQKDIERLERIQTTVYDLKRKAKVASICQIEQQLAYLSPTSLANLDRTGLKPEETCKLPTVSTDKTTYVKNICAARSLALSQTADHALWTRKCLLGMPDFETADPGLKSRWQAITCNAADPTEKALQADFVKKKRELYDARKAVVERQMGFTSSLFAMAQLHSAFTISKNVAMHIAVAALEGPLMATKSMPLMCVCGLSSGSIIDASKPFQSMYDFTKAKFESVLKTEKDIYEATKDFTEYMGTMSSQLSQLKTISAEKAVDENLAEQRIAEILGKGRQAVYSATDAWLQQGALDIDCNNQNDTIQMEMTRLQTMHNEQVFELSVETEQNDLISFEIQKLRNDILIRGLEKSNLAIDKKALQAEKGTKQTEKQTLVGIIANLGVQLDNTLDSQSRIAGLANQVDAITRTIMAQFEERFAKVAEISSASIDHLTQILQLKKTDAAKGAEELDAQLANINIEKGVKEKLQARSQEMSKKVEELRKEVVDSAKVQYAADASSPSPQEWFLASEDLLSGIVLGVPDYLEMKRDYLSRANYVLGHMRARSRMMGVFLNHTPEFPIFVKNSYDLSRIIDQLCTRVSGPDSVRCDPMPNSPFFSAKKVQGLVSSIRISGDAPLLHALNQGEEFEFELSPDISSEAEMAVKGYRKLGLTELNGDQKKTNLFLFDIRIGFTTACQSSELIGGIRQPTQQFALTHTGIGYSLKQAYSDDWSRMVEGPLFSLGQSRTVDRPGENIDTEEEETSGYKTLRAAWQGSWDAKDIPERDLSASTQQPLQFFGQPAYGRYKLKRTTSACKLSSITLNFIHNKGF